MSADLHLSASINMNQEAESSITGGSETQGVAAEGEPPSASVAVADAAASNNTKEGDLEPGASHVSSSVAIAATTAAASNDPSRVIGAGEEATQSVEESSTTMNVTDKTLQESASSSSQPFPKSQQTEEEGQQTTAAVKNFVNRRVIVYNISKFLDTKGVEKLTRTWMADRKNRLHLGDKGTHDGVAIEINKIKKPPRENWTVLTLKNESMVQPLLDYINDTPSVVNKFGEKIVAKRASDADDDHGASNNKRKADSSANNGDKTKRQRVQEELAGAHRRPVSEDEVRDKVTPLWKLSTEEQTRLKMKDMIRNCAIKVVKEVKSRFSNLQREKKRNQNVNVPPLYDWLKQKRGIEVKELFRSPTPLRNKTEFTFGYRYLFDNDDKAASSSNSTSDEKLNDATGDATEHAKVPAVGFMATGWSGGVSSPHCCANIPSEACAIADILNDFLSTSPLLPYDSKGHTGFWRTITVRSSRRTREVMIIVLHAPPPAPPSGEDEPMPDSSARNMFEAEKDRLVKLLSTAELPVVADAAEETTNKAEQQAPPLKVTSIFFQEFAGLSSPTPEHPVQHVYGKKSLQERLGKCVFEISPGAFFQTNTDGAELLYQLAVDAVREVSSDAEKTILFDVCCGTGTIGLTCLKEGVVGRIVGVDISEPAIADAKANALLNGFGSSEQTRFVAARAEHVLSKEIYKAKELSGMKFVAVVDPAREGLHAEVVRTLRQTERIDRIVYVSCNPTATLVRDAGLLCQPPTKRYSGRPFRAVSATPVDMFPLTKHCEMVMIFDRLKEDNT